MRSSWSMAKLSEVAEINPRLPRIPSDGEMVSFVPMSAVSENGRLETPEERKYQEVSKGYTPFVRGDILVAKITPCFENGKIAHANEILHPIGFGSSEFHVVRPRPHHVDARYLFHFLRQDWIRREGELKMTGSAGQQRVPESFLCQLDVPVPSLSAQRRIAEVLDRVEAVVALRRTSLVLVRQLVKNVFLDMFGSPVTNPKKWGRRPIREIGRVVTGNTPPRANPEYYGSDIEWVKSDNLNTPYHYVTPATERLSKKGRLVGRVVPAGSILVTCIAGSPECIGNAAIADRDVAFNQQINAIVPYEGDTRFIYAQLLVGRSLVQQASTGGMKGLVSKSRFEEIELLYPPLTMQREFGAVFDRIVRLESVQRASLAQLEALYASLQHRAFRGEL